MQVSVCSVRSATTRERQREQQIDQLGIEKRRRDRADVQHAVRRERDFAAHAGEEEEPGDRIRRVGMARDLAGQARDGEPPGEPRRAAPRQQACERRFDGPRIAQDPLGGLLEAALDEVAVQRRVQPLALRQHVAGEAVEDLAGPSAEVVAQRQELDVLVGAVVRQHVLLALGGHAVLALPQHDVAHAERRRHGGRHRHFVCRGRRIRMHGDAVIRQAAAARASPEGCAASRGRR